MKQQGATRNQNKSSWKFCGLTANEREWTRIR
jgi:hypothetical protein